MRSLPTDSRKITSALFVSQSLSSAARIAISSILTIVAFNITQDRATVGWPGAVINFSAAPAALIWGFLWDKIGRRKGLSLGLLFGVGGTIISTLAILYQSFSLLIIGMVGVGIAGGVIRLARFIAAEVTPPNQRAQAISIVVFSSTIGAVLGPLLIAPTSAWAQFLGWNKYIGPFSISIILYFLSTIAIFFYLKPEPLTISKKYEDEIQESSLKPKSNGRTIPQMFQYLEFNVAFIAMVLSQVVMVMIMRLTALYLVDIGYQENIIALAFSGHTLGMFAFSVYTGRLTDKFGHGNIIIAGIGILYVSFFLGATSTNSVVLILALFLLGLGWNFCFVSGSALLSAQLSTTEKSRTQGFNDLFIALGSGFSGLLAAKLYNLYGFRTLNIVSAWITIIPLVLTLWWMQNRKTSKLS